MGPHTQKLFTGNSARDVPETPVVYERYNSTTSKEQAIDARFNSVRPTTQANNGALCNVVGRREGEQDVPVKAVRKRVNRIQRKNPKVGAAKALALAKKRQAAYKKQNKKGKTATQKAQGKKRQGAVKKRVVNIKKTGQAQGKAAWALAKKREKKMFQKDKTTKMPRYLWSDKRKANNPKPKKAKAGAKDAKKPKGTITTPGEKDKPGFGRVKNPNANKLRFAKRPGTKRRIL